MNVGEMAAVVTVNGQIKSTLNKRTKMGLIIFFTIVVTFRLSVCRAAVR